MNCVCGHPMEDHHHDPDPPASYHGCNNRDCLGDDGCAEYRPVEEKTYTPEKVRELLVNIEKLKANYRSQLERMDELAHTLVSKVGIEHELWAGRHYFELEKAPRCQRCGNRLGSPYTEKVYEFDKKFWHKHNCKGTTP